MEYAYLCAGLIILLVSGEILVKGSVNIALRFRVSTLVIGMTIVSIGTSTPELLVSLKAVLQDKPDITLGAIIGSNISNLALVLGITALIFQVKVNRDTIRIDWPMMMISTVLIFILIQDKVLGIFEGIALFSMLGIFTFWLIRRSRKKNKKESDDETIEKVNKSTLSLFKDIGLIIIGCIGLVYGAEWFLNGASKIALNFDISERVIGLTLVAVGTSLPELITSLVAAYRKQMDISIGNLIGSNIFNLLSILGITSFVKEIKVNDILLNFDIYWLLGISALILPIMLYKGKVTRIEGLILLIIYFVYVYLTFSRV